MKRFLTTCLVASLLFLLAPSSLAASDIKGHWAEPNLRFLIDKGIMNGYPDGTVKPENHITRAEFAILIMNTLAQLPSEEEVSITDTPVLSDLDPNDPSQSWYIHQVMAAVSQEIIKGTDKGTFEASNKITREEMATMLVRALNKKGVNSTPVKLTFADADLISDWSKEYIQRIVFLEIMNGKEGNRFAPAEPSTRAEVATVLVRMLEKLNNSEPTLTYTHYNLTLDEMVNKQMQASTPPQTDKYGGQQGYISGDYVKDVYEEADGKKFGFIHADVLRVRKGPSTDTDIVGRINSNLDNPTKVQLQGEVTNEKGELWYEIKYGSWTDAKREDVAYYVNPENFQAGSKEYYQFLVLSKRAGITAEELNNKILMGKGTLEGQGQAFIDAATQYNINEIYLVAHALLETGQGFSSLAQGIEVDQLMERDSKDNPILDEDGNPKMTPVEKKTVYNFFGIGAVDSCPQTCGADRAYREGWFTPEAAIIGGANFISQKYINNPTYMQDTLYKMRWNPAVLEDPAKKPEHQYATDIGWAVKQVNRMYEMYQLLDSYTLYYDVPVYKK